MAKLPASLYSLVFALSLILINPWGEQRGDVWTHPKLLVVHLITTCNTWMILHQGLRGALKIPVIWKVGLGFWTLFLSAGLVATLNSPFPLRSLWGQSTLGDGWAYWVLLAAFVLSNALVVRQIPTLLRTQLSGLLIGGTIVALSIFPQVFDWRIDYTATSGLVSLSNSQMLASTVWHNHMPIGLYSSRGHAAFVLAVVGVLALLGWRWRWISTLPAGGVILLTSISLVCTHVRGGIIAFLVAALYVLWYHLSFETRQRFLQRYGTTLYLTSCMCVIVVALFCLKHLERFSSGRLHLWLLSLKGIAERPVWGWGFDGFGIAFPYIADWAETHKGYLLKKVAVAQIIELGDFTFNYQGIDGQFYTGILISSKAHNLLLDTTVSLGVLGLICYALLWWFFLRCTLRTTYQGLEAVAIAYLVYTFTWYESAQFSHLAWWALSVGVGAHEQKHFNAS